jgi:CheY-like chemotaxis protein
MLVDDYGPFAMSLSLALAPDFDVEVKLSGLEALARLGRPRFDAVLCDVVMPDLSGIDLYQRVHVSCPELAERFVFLTAGAITPADQRFLAQTGLPVVRKPFDLSALVDTLEKLWARVARSQEVA